jgi:hypothetical protein
MQMKDGICGFLLGFFSEMCGLCSSAYFGGGFPRCDRILFTTETTMRAKPTTKNSKPAKPAPSNCPRCSSVSGPDSDGDATCEAKAPAPMQINPYTQSGGLFRGFISVTRPQAFSSQMISSSPVPLQPSVAVSELSNASITRTTR